MGKKKSKKAEWVPLDLATVPTTADETQLPTFSRSQQNNEIDM